MARPYQMMKALAGKETTRLKDLHNVLPKDSMEHLLNGNMKGHYLGDCLDNCRWGSIHTVMFEMSVQGMIDFIHNWMDQNKDNFTELFHELAIDKTYEHFDLPRISHGSCPVSEDHYEMTTDLFGRVRCRESMEKSFKKGFAYIYEHFDIDSNTIEPDAMDLFPNDEYMEIQYNKAETITIKQKCMAIIEDGGTILPLETVIKRLNFHRLNDTEFCTRRYDECEIERTDYCRGHQTPAEKLEFYQMDGWTLAHYVQRWYEQDPEGNAPVYELPAMRVAPPPGFEPGSRG